MSCARCGKWAPNKPRRTDLVGHRSYCDACIQRAEHEQGRARRNWARQDAKRAERLARRAAERGDGLAESRLLKEAVAKRAEAQSGPRVRVPSPAEIAKANAGTWKQRKQLARRYGLSGAVAAAIGLYGVEVPSSATRYECATCGAGLELTGRRSRCPRCA